MGVLLTAKFQLGGSDLLLSLEACLSATESEVTTTELPMSPVMMEIKPMELADSTTVPVILMGGIVQVEILQGMIHE